LLMPVSDMSVVGDEFNTTLHNSLLVRWEYVDFKGLRNDILIVKRIKEAT
jgi:hypothetical protein